MRIRSITLGVNHDGVDVSELKDDIASFFSEAENLFLTHDVEVRTQRIGLAPFSIKKEEDGLKVLSTIESVSSLCESLGLRWFVVPFRTVGQNLNLTNEFALKVMEKCDKTFVNFIVTENNSIDTESVNSAARFVQDVSQISENGFDNFRFGTSFNTKPNGAFFPFMHHEGENGFSIALELILPIVNVIKQNPEKTLENLRAKIVEELLQTVISIDKISQQIENSTGMKYYGIDASLAPHPERAESSVGYLFNLLGVNGFGSSGTSFIASFLTDIIKTVIKASGVRAVGFNGVMYSVLEDYALGEVSRTENSLPKSQLLALSAICGCGIDMVPVPGDISREEISSVMLDVGAMAVWLNKPLGVRLLPVPEKAVGDLTDFEHDFFINTRIQGGSIYNGCDIDFDGKKPFVYSRDA